MLFNYPTIPLLGGHPHFILLLALQEPAIIIIIINTRKRPKLIFRFIILRFLNYVYFTQSNKYFLNTHIQPKKILLAPLDWGLGHATRCISLISYLQFLNCEITIAASGKQKILLQNEFPQLNFLDLPGYNIDYSNKKRWLPLKILIQIPKILKIIRFENRWLKTIISQSQFDGVISDNRYGLSTNKIRSVFITHQLQVKTPFIFLEKILRKISYRFINRFHECWIPDMEGGYNLAGSLSHPGDLPSIPVKYIGPLSRFKKSGPQEIRYKWMVIISGPEPQRTIFERKILKCAAASKDQFLIVRGMPDEKAAISPLANCTVHNHLKTEEMSSAILSSTFIISRCGYTTVMELLSLQKKSILIPTPGQTEQEYLAKHLMQERWCYSLKQGEDFTVHLEKVQQFNFNLPAIDTQTFKPVLENFISSLPLRS
jgi:uncharacterized protein (TIGR00661 family)